MGKHKGGDILIKSAIAKFPSLVGLNRRLKRRSR